MQRNAELQRATSFLSILLCILLVSPPIPAQEGAREGRAEAGVDEPAQPEAPADTEALEPPPVDDEDLLRPDFRPEKSEGIEEIRVTTTQSELTAQDEAVSVTQFSAADIQDFRIQDISDLSDYTPNLEINTAFAASNPTVFIRGIGLKDYNANSAGSVAIYTDGIYVNSGAGQLFQMFDIANVEVLRGPQGTQSARNATAGAIKVYSNKPDGEFSGYSSLSYGNFNILELETAFGFPILGDILSARVAGTANFRDGYVQNKCRNTEPYDALTNPEPECDFNGFNFRNTGRVNRLPVAELGDFEDLKKWQNNAKNWAVRGLVKLTPTDTVDLLANVHWGQNRSDSLHLQMKGTGSNGLNTITFAEDSRPRFDLDPYVGWYDQDGQEFLDVLGGSVTADLDFGFVHVISITGYESNERFVEDEGDAMPNIALTTDWFDTTWQVTQELRVDGDGENYQWSAGGYFLYEDVQATNLFKDLNFTPIRQTFDQQLITFAPYAHGTWEFDDFWSVELGARYNWERKDFALGTTVEFWERIELSPGVFAAGWDACCRPSTNISSVALPPVSTRGTWAAPTGEFTVNFEPVEDVRLYIKYARGMKGGHFNASSFTDDQSLEPVEPEFVHSGEFGIKSQWLDGAVVFNSAVFYYDYDDLQVFDIANEVGKPAVQQLLNSDATALGVEAEFAFRPHPDLFASLGFGWLDATFGKFLVPKQVNPPFARGGAKATHTIFDFTGNPLIAAPRFSLTGNVEYTIPLGRFGTLVPGFDFSFKDKVSLDPSNKVELQQPAFWLLNARLSYRTPDERISLQGWVRNLTEKVYLIDAFDQSIDVNQILYVVSEPRFFGFTLTLDW